MLQVLPQNQLILLHSLIHLIFCNHQLLHWRNYVHFYLPCHFTKETPTLFLALLTSKSLIASVFIFPVHYIHAPLHIPQQQTLFTCASSASYLNCCNYSLDIFVGASVSFYCRYQFPSMQWVSLTCSSFLEQ